MIIDFEMYPTVITPYTCDNKIDYESLDRLIRLYAECKVDGIFAVCQSSEMFFLSDEEKLELAAFCIEKCRELNIKCVVSGHTQDTVEEQISYLQRLESLDPDAVIFVNNRFARQDEPEEVCIRNFRRVTGALKPETRLGVYECPYPYKRLISDELLEAMCEDSRFLFIKDTSCSSKIIHRRLDIIKGSQIKLFNANTATLYESVIMGAAGYSGVMLNILPELFTELKNSFANEGDCAGTKAIADLVTVSSVIECQNYPVNAKYAMMKRGIVRTTLTRSGKPAMAEHQMKEMDAFLTHFGRT